MSRTEKTLALLLQLTAGLLLVALVPAMMPLSWMVAIHRWVGGVEHFFDAPLASYLARSLSAMYAIHGSLLLYVSFDVRRYLPVIRFLMIVSVVFGAGMIVLDCAVGMPLWWIVGEGPLIILLAAWLLWLVARIERQAGRAQGH